MAELNCTACEELKTEVPSLITDGLTSSMCTSIRNDTGLKASSGNDDCEDLNNLNDCLVGNMETEIDRYDVCEWKPFTQDLISNLHTTLKAMICAICGIWTNIHNLWTYAKSYRLKKNGTKIYLEAEDGKHGEVDVSDINTTYTLGGSGHTVRLTGSDGQTSGFTVPDEDTRYQIHTTTYQKDNITIRAGDTAVVDIPVTQPSEFTDTLYPMAIAGWTWEGTFASYLITRYIQLVDRSGSPKIRVAVRNIATEVQDGSHDATVTLYGEVLWWGRRTD